MKGIVAEQDGGLGERLAEAVRALIRAWKQERALFWTGVFSVFLGVVGLVIFAANGRFIPPEGDLAKPIAFNLATGIYILTIALLAPLADFSPRGRHRWRVWNVALTLGALAIENIQAYRGLDPRFASDGAILNRLLGFAFLLIGIGIIVAFIVLALRFRRRQERSREALLLLGIRYACLAAMLAFGAGVWMSLIRGLRLATPLDLMPLHAIGFHALQALPLTALLLGPLPHAAARRWLHVAGSAWLASCAALGWQAFSGRPVFEWAPATISALSFLIFWAMVTARAAHVWLRAGLQPLPTTRMPIVRLSETPTQSVLLPTHRTTRRRVR